MCIVSLCNAYSGLQTLLSAMKCSLLSYSSLDNVDLIITDHGITEEELQPYRSVGAKIEVVSEDRSN